MELAGKKILLGVSGGIAVYKSCELLRLLQKKGAEVRVCMTDAATEFVAPLTFASLSKCPVYLKNGAVEARPFQHIDFPRWADLYLVVPATANVIGKFACGIADDPVSLCFMSCTCPRVIAPAMNVAMYNSPAVKRNLEILRGFEDTTVLESPAGELACGEVGQGRLMEPAEIVAYLETRDERRETRDNEGESLPLASAAGASSATPSPVLSNAEASGGHPRNAPEPPAFPVAQDMDPTRDPTLPGHGKKVLLTAGRTEEAIDPVRYISNRSSGKTAVALASVFYANGFEVEVIAGPMEAAFPGGVAVSRVQSAREMHDAVMSRLESVDAVVHCAAVADYRPAHAADSKIKDSRSQLTIELVPNPNILRDCIAARKANASSAAGDARRQVIVGFALETDNFKQHAAEKLEKSGADALLLNAPVASDSGFGHNCVRYALVRPHAGIPEMHMGSKVDLAQEIVHFVLNELG
ncbi:MAG: bifunctional phosphopantothenoylcysteine decarboxylase/phosphopantothenate synthase [Fibrobacter sp.]|uniref:bifunctional phosphopantothenoylcysteine decarboxylase/phosphopantothenate synthase n=1 Tax=Fibrobacter sp. TaxID=35828 RepID=UPI001B23B3B6|nr:bifunctional phosphopantothenoylcysteine decarboxylase/phosphopantothenate synthase [Fibrobacter sp.]MBO7060814.1 bifunctional phosphopantothenoylcysteine decarboxylase/phosphopantothenate synthase [Fibrobacter sp.]